MTARPDNSRGASVSEHVLLLLPAALRRSLFRTALRAAPLLDASRGRDPGILDIVEGRALAPGGRLCLFAHHDRGDRVDPHVMHALAALRGAGAQIVFVTTCSAITQDDLEGLRSHCALILRRENVGYDFGSWKAGLSVTGWAQGRDGLILANDSVYGPLTGIGEVLDRMSLSPDDFCSVTASQEGGHHFQSYFLYLKPATFEDPGFRGFWEKLVMHRSKLAMVQAGEIGFTQFLEGYGFRGSALVPLQDLLRRFPEKAARQIAASPSGAINPTRAFWLELAGVLGSPFIKVDIIRDRLRTAPGIARWSETVAASQTYDPALIDAHIARIRALTESGTDG